MRATIERYWRELQLTMDAMPHAALAQVADALLDCRARGGTIFIVGNGGSAATASHFACDLAKGTQSPGAIPFRVVPLTDNMPLLTAWANDVSYEQVYAQQLATLIRPGDVLVAISASGSSPNILAAARAATRHGANVIAWTGATGGKLLRLANLIVRVPAHSIEQVEDAHLMISHSLCVALRERIRLLATDRAETSVILPVALDREEDASLAL
ncbi:MAG TPA: SIS domain-containing protein [Ktedonobacterales bacterium]|nr:SIS domain-containing protein [Ktedonobacterales bacterium]